MIQQAPITMLHHTSWQVEDVDEIGRGATALLGKDPGRHVWGLGRHHIGSNFWTDSRAFFSWGPPPPPSFLEPEDLASMMASAHLPG